MDTGPVPPSPAAAIDRLDVSWLARVDQFVAHLSGRRQWSFGCGSADHSATRR